MEDDGVAGVEHDTEQDISVASGLGGHLDLGDVLLLVLGDIGHDLLVGLHEGDLREVGGQGVGGDPDHHLARPVHHLHHHSVLVVDLHRGVTSSSDIDWSSLQDDGLELIVTHLLLDHGVGTARIVEHIYWPCLTHCLAEHEDWVTIRNGVDDSVSTSHTLKMLSGLFNDGDTAIGRAGTSGGHGGLHLVTGGDISSRRHRGHYWNWGDCC